MLKLNSNKVEFGNFPNNEHYLPIEQLKIHDRANVVQLIYENDSDLVKLAILKNWLDEMNAPAELHLPYMPHSRMDRANGTYAVSLHAICQLINSLNFYKVVVREPHSPETTRLINNVEVEDWCLNRVRSIFKRGGFDSVCFPDHGAKTRYDWDESGKTSWGEKERDFLTGEIKGLKLIGECGKNVLIIDDICSRGGTFVRIAKLLKEKGTNRIGLLVSYVENTIFKGEIFDYVDVIYTNNDFELVFEHPRIEQID